MNKQEAFYSWLSGFSLPVYAEGSVPNNAALPYITFSWSQAQTFDSVSVTATAYARTKSAKKLTSACDSIVNDLAQGGVTLQCTDGLLWLTSASPAMQCFELEECLKGCYININIQFLTL